MTSATTPRLRIEPLAPQHPEGLFAALNDDRVGRYIGGHEVTTLDALRARIVRLLDGAPDGSGETWLNWAVHADDVVVGRVEATLHSGIAEIAYVFGPVHWGQGYATEATAWMIGEVRALGCAECWATVLPENVASVRLLRRLGFIEAEPGDLALQSYDDGDLTFVLR